MDPKNKGLVIRRKADKDAGETQPLGEVAVADTAPAPEPVKPLAAPAPGLVQAAPEAPVAAVEPAPAPAPTPAPKPAKPVKATADDGRGKVWRAEASKPAAKAEVAKAAEPTSTYERPTEMPTTDDFAAMLGDAPMASADPTVGERVKATIVAIGADNIFVALGAKSEGVLSSGDFVDNEGNLTVAVGDEIEAVVVSVGGDGIRLATALGGAHGGSEMLEEAQQAGIPVEGRVTGTNKGGFDVEVMGARGFCPFSQMDLDSSAEPETFVGQTLLFLVQRVEEGGRNVVVSRAALLRAERAAKAAEMLDTVKEGAIFNGVVSRVQDFGAFVDIGGVDGLVHVSEISYSRLDHPSEMLKEGDAVRVVVMRVTDLHDDRNRRIGLSMRALEEDPWGIAVRELQAGTTIQGTVSRLETFGAFVELRPGVDGLVHVSEIAQGKRINHPKDVLTVGDDVEVQVMRIDPQKRQIGLSMRALMDDPWSQAAKAYPRGTTVQGTVESVQKFGIFVGLQDGVTGLLPMSHLPEGQSQTAFSKFRPGNAIEARVLELDISRRRLTLTQRDDSEMLAGEEFKAYQAQTRAEPMGTFADLLKNRK